MHKNLKRSRICIVALLCLAAAGAFAIDIPKLQTRVTDLAGVLTPEQTATLEEKLKQFETSDSTQIAVLILPGLQGEVLEDFSMRVAEAWRLGQKGRDNGALLLVAMKERKVRIEVGYGLEANLTDALSRRIIQNEIIPYFRQGEFYAGIDSGVNAMMQAVRGVYKATARPGSRSGQGNGSGSALNWIVFLLIPGLWLLGSAGKWGGGLLGGGAGTFLMYSLLGLSLGPMLIGGLFGALGGIFLGGIIQSAARQTNPRRMGGGPFIPRGGGFWGGGFGGGGFGGFGGGGFSGGGGGFGGGGASGGW